jgi:acyl-CoA dehydrogenase
MTYLSNWTPIDVAPEAGPTRTEIRALIDDTVSHLSTPDRARSWSARDEEFSRTLGARGWIGITWPREFGGEEAGHLVRYRIAEELIAAGAPVAAHWFADRQSGAMLLRYGSDVQKRRFLPAMARGELYFCIGMSEPGAGSDLSALSTGARRVEGGWKVNGSKIWTSHADHSHYMIALVRTDSGAENQHKGLSQLLVDLASPGVAIRPIVDQMGEQHFCETFLDDVFVPDDMVLGEVGHGWEQVTTELAFERSGPERYLSSHVLVERALASIDAEASDAVSALVGGWAAEIWTLRQMSLSVAAKLNRGENPMIEASIVKDLGARFEQAVPRELQALCDDPCFSGWDDDLDETLNFLLGTSVCFSLRGGTREILRGIIARGLGLR